MVKVLMFVSNSHSYILIIACLKKFRDKERERNLEWCIRQRSCARRTKAERKQRRSAFDHALSELVDKYIKIDYNKEAEEKHVRKAITIARSQNCRTI